MIIDSGISTGSLEVSGSFSVQGTSSLNQVLINGALVITGSLNISGSVEGTASFATSASFAETASYVLNVVSSSFAVSSSRAVSSSFAVTASFALNAAGGGSGTKDFILMSSDNAVDYSGSSIIRFDRNGVGGDPIQRGITYSSGSGLFTLDPAKFYLATLTPQISFTNATDTISFQFRNVPFTRTFSRQFTSRPVSSTFNVTGPNTITTIISGSSSVGVVVTSVSGGPVSLAADTTITITEI